MLTHFPKFAEARRGVLSVVRLANRTDCPAKKMSVRMSVCASRRENPAVALRVLALAFSPLGRVSDESLQRIFSEVSGYKASKFIPLRVYYIYHLSTSDVKSKEFPMTRQIVDHENVYIINKKINHFTPFCYT